MPKRANPTPLEQMDALSDLMTAFETRAADEPALTDAVLDEVIRLVPGKRAIIAGHVGERPAIFRFHLSKQVESAARDWAELTRAHTYMNTGDLRVSAPICHLPDLGLVVSERAPGMPLMVRIWQTPPAGRPALLPPAAAWLRKYTAPTEAPTPVRLDGWFGRADKALARLRYAELRELKTAIVAELTRISTPHEAGTWRMAICHGDFHPNNLLSEGTRLTGIDTGGSARLPVVKDIARFLTHMGRRGLLPSGSARYGVDAGGIPVFADALELTEVERDIWLPFMIGIEALVRVESSALSRSRIRRSTAFCEALLADLRALRV